MPPFYDSVVYKVGPTVNCAIRHFADGIPFIIKYVDVNQNHFYVLGVYL